MSRKKSFCSFLCLTVCWSLGLTNVVCNVIPHMHFLRKKRSRELQRIRCWRCWTGPGKLFWTFIQIERCRQSSFKEKYCIFRPIRRTCPQDQPRLQRGKPKKNYSHTDIFTHTHSRQCVGQQVQAVGPCVQLVGQFKRGSSLSSGGIQAVGVSLGNLDSRAGGAQAGLLVGGGRKRAVAQNKEFCYLTVGGEILSVASSSAALPYIRHLLQ